ncbi:MAG: hypothetical protein C4297_01740 [Gemmataceae bacterium]
MRTAMWVGLAALFAAAVVGFYWPWNHNSPLVVHGVVEVQEVRLGPRVGGRVAAVLVEEGSVAEAGQLLVRLEAPELAAQKAQWEARLQQAQAALEKARNGSRAEEIAEAQAAADAAQARWQRLKNGPRPEEIREARSELDSAEADARWAAEDWERAQRILAQGAGSRAEFDAARAAYERARGRLAAAWARLDLLLAGSRAEDIAEAEAHMRAARARWQLLVAGTRREDLAAAEALVQEMQARLQEIHSQLAELHVRAAERVFIEIVAARPGDLVAPHQPIVRALRAADQYVKAYVPETELGKIRHHQQVEVTCDAYPHLRLTGSVYYIANESEFTPRNVQSVEERRHQVFAIRVRVDDPQGILKPGMAAQVWIATGQAP